MDLATRMARFEQADLYVVITEAFCAGRSGLDVLDACLRAGVRHFLTKLPRDAMVYGIGVDGERRAGNAAVWVGG